MVRTQIQLTEEQAERLKRVARQRDISMAEAVREAVDAYTSASPPSRRALLQRAERAFGRFSSGAHDVATEHDAYLEEAFDH